MIESVSEMAIISESYGWQKIHKNKLTLWFKGYLHRSDGHDIHFQLVQFLKSKNFNINNLSKWCKELNGHFAMIVITSDSIFAAVDKINTIPLFFRSINKDFVISNKPSAIKERFSLDHNKINHNAALEIAMSGFSIGGKTIFQNLFQLMAGECLFFKDDFLKKIYYYTYSPWKLKERSESILIADLNISLESTLSELVESTKGRQILIPLSAGYDSRLIASGLKYFGVSDVLCFSYGVKGNFESKMAKSIANKLGFKWKHICISPKDKKKFFKSEKFSQYLLNYDSYSSIPAVQDIAEICYLKEEKIVSEDSIIINGNSGDYISGGHLFQREQLVNDTWKQYLLKHYSLWKSLNTDSNKSKIINQFQDLINDRKIPNLKNNNESPFLIEALEYLGRQSMYVVNQQDAYDYNHYDWRLPLWSDSFLTFWETVPYEYKFNQNLYTKVLHKNNWGGVWNDIPLNEKKIHPHWIRPLRFASKAIFSPFGKDVWHSFEKHFFLYWMDLTRNSVITPYHKVLLDNNGHKNMFSWISKEYLEQKNFFIK